MDIEEAIKEVEWLWEDKNLTENRLRAIDVLVDAIKQLQEERLAIQNDERLLTCVFCEETYPPGTPTNNHESLRAHVAICKEHPMTKVVEEKEAYRKAFKLLHSLATNRYRNHPMFQEAEKLIISYVTILRSNYIIH